MRVVLALILVACHCSVVLAAPAVGAYSGFMKGETYMQLSQAERGVYAMGLLDGLFGSAFYGADSAQLGKLQACTAGWTNTQLSAVLDQHVRANPSSWQHPMNVLLVNALVKACPDLRPGPNNSSKPTPLRGAA